MGEKKIKNVNWKNILQNEAKLRGYSQRTIDAYVYHVNRFIQSGKSAREFLLELINQKKATETVRGAGFAVKFYLKCMNERDTGIDEIINHIPNMKRGKKLPVILAKEEIESMIESTNNLNHRTIMLIGYGAGLRASEICSLRWSDIDFKRNLIHVKQAKGKKDRIVMLSTKVKKALRSLSKEQEGLVLVTTRGMKYTLRTIQMIIQNAAKKAGIRKKVTPHTLRHSFATHLLENGTDIRYIKDLLGHADVRTTLIYTKVSNKDLARIKSPLD